MVSDTWDLNYLIKLRAHFLTSVLLFARVKYFCLTNKPISPVKADFFFWIYSINQDLLY